MIVLNRLYIYLYFFMMLLPFTLTAQIEVQWLKKEVSILAAPAMQGRGYINGGGEKAARYIAERFREINLQRFNGSYFQPYKMSINTFPGKLKLKVNGKTLRPGIDYMVHGASSGRDLTTKRFIEMDLAGVKDSLSWMKIKARFNNNGAYVLQHIDTLLKYRGLTVRTLARELRNGFFLVSMGGKLSWLANADTVSATIVYVADSVLSRKIRKIRARIKTRFIPDFPNQNLVGFVPGTRYPDRFLVITAHYDHLGWMGKKALFPGANDNASGVAMLLWLADYYAKHPPAYSIAFMAFSGEEAGLIGSEYYTRHPLFPLENIRFLVNIDMAGDATGGITIVNAIANSEEFSRLQTINAAGHYLPGVFPRAQARNSDHFPFSEKGVPAIYLYTNGIKPYYHDLRDTPEAVDFENGAAVLGLLKDFLEKIP